MSSYSVQTLCWILGTQLGPGAWVRGKLVKGLGQMARGTIMERHLWVRPEPEAEEG